VTSAPAPSAVSRRAALLAGLALAAPSLARAQVFAQRPVRIVVPFAPGGASDVTARIVATHLTARLDRQVIVENKPGAATVIGASEVARSPADGHTLLLAPPPFVITQFAYPNLPYDPVRDFRPVALLVTSPIVLVVPAASPAADLAALVAAAKARPGGLSYGSPGEGSLPHVAFELLKLRAGLDVTHVPYRGGGPAVVDAVAGRLDALLASPLEVAGHVQSGRLRVLAVASAQREASLPGVPTFAEGGVPNFVVTGWFGLVAPSAVPDPLVARLNAEIGAVLAQADVRTRIAELGATPAPGAPEAFGALLTAERAQWAEAVRAARVRVE
jgi:tripartite-type tricarboxylate transporter receptor subunit TctC